MLLQNLRAKIGARLDGTSKESGFTLIELLVVMLILGILAAIALPAFFNQKDKAGDAKAKEYAHSAQVAMETCATDNDGQYGSCDEDALRAIEPTLSSATFTTTDLDDTTYTITVTSDTDNTFGISSSAGSLTYPCETAGDGGCPDNAPAESTTGDWGG